MGVLKILFLALVLCLFPDFYGVFLFDRKVFFCGCDSLDDPKPGMPVTVCFAGSGLLELCGKNDLDIRPSYAHSVM